MNLLSLLMSIVAGGLALMMTVVAAQTLRKLPMLNSPIVPICVGLLTYIGLRYRPDGLIGMILIGYEAVAISIFFLLLLAAFRKVRRFPLRRDQGSPRIKQSDFLKLDESNRKKETQGGEQRQ